MALKLVLPDLKYKNDILSAAKEFARLKHKTLSDKRYEMYEKLSTDDQFQQEIVQPALDAMNGVNLKPGFVPATEFWIIDTDEKGRDTYIGRITLRHKLNGLLKQVYGHFGYDIVPSHRGKGYMKQALRLAIEKAHEIGIPQVFLTCDESNVASIKTIRGVLKEYGGYEIDPFPTKDYPEIESDGDKEVRFWVNTSKQNTRTPLIQKTK